MVGRGTFTQPCDPPSVCVPGPYDERHGASWIAWPSLVNQSVNSTREGAYQYLELWGQGERMIHGEFLRSTEKLPVGVGRASRPVVIGVSAKVEPSWHAVNSWAGRLIRIVFPARPEHGDDPVGIAGAAGGAAVDDRGDGAGTAGEQVPGRVAATT
jgi:hypothetical protein